MSTATATSLRLSRVVHADVDTAFRAWTQPEHIRRWACPEGHTIADSRVDLVVGGSYMLQMTNDEGLTHTARGTYREIDPPHRLVYTWDWDEDHKMGIDTRVTAEFRAVDGGTEITLVHEGFPSEELTQDHLMGWTSCIDKYERFIGEHAASPAAAGA